MARKKIPFFFYILFIGAFTAALVYYGGLFMRKNFIYADVTLDDFGIVLLNRDKQNQNWPGGFIYLNKISDKTRAPFGEVKAGTAVRVPYLAFDGIYNDAGISEYSIKKVYLSMEGYQNRKFTQVVPHVLSKETPSLK